MSGKFRPPLLKKTHNAACDGTPATENPAPEPKKRRLKYHASNGEVQVIGSSPEELAQSATSSFPRKPLLAVLNPNAIKSKKDQSLQGGFHSYYNILW